MNGRSLMQTLAGARRVAFVGLAKNTGKTVAVTRLIEELDTNGRSLGITSIGRDGEEFDAIRPQIRKPRIVCPPGTLVATAFPLLRRSGAAHELLGETDVWTPLGRIVVARFLRVARCEIAGPSSAAELRVVIAEMLALGADSVIVDGSIDRRAAAAPSIADAVVVATGAVLGAEVKDVVMKTVRAFGWASVARVKDLRIRSLATAAANRSVMMFAERVIPLPNAFALTVKPRDLRLLLGAGTDPVLLVGGVLPESLLEALLPYAKSDRIRVVAGDPTKVFVSSKSIDWYRSRGVAVEVLERARLGAVTVNPVRPPWEHLDSRRLCEAIDAGLKHRVPVMDVMAPSYLAGMAEAA